MWNVLGQDEAVQRLRTALDRGNLAHALLLVGPAGVGKRTLARELAKALNCVGEEPRPCQKCLHCRQIEAVSHPDVSLMAPAEGKENILIEQVRALREEAALRPFQGRTKVHIIWGAEALTAQAADALLKTLEEPEPQVVMILTALEPEALPPTLVSRCQILTLRRVPNETIAEALRARVPQEQAERLARLARGSVGWAMRAARDKKLVEQRDELTERLTMLLDLDLAGRLDIVDWLMGERRGRPAARGTLEILLALAGDLLHAGQGLPSRLASPEQAASLAAQAGRLGLDRVRAYIELIRVAMNRLEQNVDVRLTFEALVTSAP